MASTAEKLLSSVNFGALGKAKELRKRIKFVIIALIIYRAGTYIPIPGVDSKVLYNIVSGQYGGFFDMFNMFSGGAFGRGTVFTLGVFPYITASIIISLMTALSPALNALKKEGEAGRRKINQYTRYLTVFITIPQAYAISKMLASASGPAGQAVSDPNVFFHLTTVLTLIGGVMFLMWIGEQITQRGIGNGTSLIIFTGIVSGIPSALVKLFELGRTGALSTIAILAIIILTVGLVSFIVFMERAHRRVLVQYPKRQVGNKIFGGDSSHMPLKVNVSGVIPPIFAYSLLSFPAVLAGIFRDSTTGASPFDQVAVYLGHGQPLYMLCLVTLITFFCFFYMKNVFNPTETADNLKKNGGFIPGIRPGANTADYLNYIMTRLTVIGAIYISIVCAVPEFLIAKWAIPFGLGGTSMLIVVNVSMDTVAQIHSHLFAHQYEGLLKKAKLKGTRG